MTSSIEDPYYPTVKVDKRKKSSSENVMSPKGRDKLTDVRIQRHEAIQSRIRVRARYSE
jgi:hypothetical protein